MIEEKTLIIFKPDAVQRQLVGEILARFERKGLKIVASKFMHISGELAAQHYAVHEGKPFYNKLVSFLSSSPVLLMVLQAHDAIAMTRKLMGFTFGMEAEPGTIRGDFGCSKGNNLVHGSDSPESAEFEIGLYFRPEEMVDYELTNREWLKPQNDD